MRLFLPRVLRLPFFAVALLLLPLLLCSAAAFAQAQGVPVNVPLPTASGGTVDLTPLFQIVLAFLAVVLPALGTYIAYILDQKMKVDANSAAGNAVSTAAQQGAGIAYSLLAQTAGAMPHTIQMRNAAIAAGISHVLATVPDSAKLREETGASIGQMVAGELGKLEAADPNISIGPVTASTTVPAAPAADKPTEPAGAVHPDVPPASPPSPPAA